MHKLNEVAHNARPQSDGVSVKAARKLAVLNRLQLRVDLDLISVISVVAVVAIIAVVAVIATVAVIDAAIDNTTMIHRRIRCDAAPPVVSVATIVVGKVRGWKYGCREPSLIAYRLGSIMGAIYGPPLEGITC